MAKATKSVAAKISKTTSASKTNGAKAKFENPYRAGGSYATVCDTLAALGLDKMHKAEALLAQYPKVAGAAWKEFKAKEGRNENAKDASGRIIQNAIVVNRADYGLPLRRAGWEVRKDRGADGYSFGLFALTAADKAKAAKVEIVRESRKEAPTAEPKAKAKKAPKAKAKAAKMAKAK